LTTWFPDTCHCIIEYDNKIKFVRTIKRCSFPAHVAATGAAHLTVLLAHNRSFMIQSPYDARNPTPASTAAFILNQEVKKAEKLRSL